MMHEQAYSAVEQMVAQAREAGWAGRATSGLDVGGQDVNGTARAVLPPSIEWDSLDLHDDTADYVEDARSWCCIEEHYEVSYDVVLCTEVLEHTRWWPLVLRTCFEACWTGGLILITAAAPPRGAHSAQGLDQKPDDEWYENINPDELRELVDEVFRPSWVRHAYRASPGDVYLCAIK